MASPRDHRLEDRVDSGCQRDSDYRVACGAGAGLNETRQSQRNRVDVHQSADCGHHLLAAVAGIMLGDARNQQHESEYHAELECGPNRKWVMESGIRNCTAFL